MLTARVTSNSVIRLMSFGRLMGLGCLNARRFLNLHLYCLFFSVLGSPASTIFLQSLLHRGRSSGHGVDIVMGGGCCIIVGVLLGFGFCGVHHLLFHSTFCSWWSWELWLLPFLGRQRDRKKQNWGLSLDISLRDQRPEIRGSPDPSETGVVPSDNQHSLALRAGLTLGFYPLSLMTKKMRATTRAPTAQRATGNFSFIKVIINECFTFPLIADVAQWQRVALLMLRLRVRVPPSVLSFLLVEICKSTY